MNPRPHVLLAILTLTGCATVGPNYQPPTLEVPGRWSQAGAADTASVDAATGDITRWWERLEDPVLSELVEEALRTSPDLRSAQARLREARARRGVAAAERFPTVSASGNSKHTWQSEEVGTGEQGDLFTAGFDASWELDLFGRVRRSVEAAEADLASAEADRNGAQVSLVAEVARSYVEVRALQVRLRIARDNLASQSETLQLTEWRAQAGLVGEQDVEQARSNREQTRAQIPALETSFAEAEHRLDVLLGKTPGTLHAHLTEGSGLPDLPDEIAAGIPADTLRQRPDVRAAERTLAAETARVGVAEAARYPSLTLSGSIGPEALSLSALGNTGAATSSLLAGITAPIFNAGRLRQQVEAQDAVRDRALVAYEQAVLTALQDVEDALVALGRSRERTEALARAAEAARTAADLAHQRYSAGLADFQPVLDTQRSVLSVEDSLASTRADSVLALIRLYKALGGGWSPQPEAPLARKDTP